MTTTERIDAARIVRLAHDVTAAASSYATWQREPSPHYDNAYFAEKAQKAERDLVKATNAFIAYMDAHPLPGQTKRML